MPFSRCGWIFLWMIACVGTVCADDFASDLAQCAKAPIAAASYASDDMRKAAKFVVEHGECVPMVTGGDPLLYGMSPGIAHLQEQGVLRKGAQACFDDSFGKGSREIAGVLSKFIDSPPMSTLVPSKGKQLLIEIAKGQTNQVLYQVPGVALIANHVSCACAVSSTALDLDALRERIKDTIASIEGCKNVLGKLLGKAYDTAKAAYGAAKDAVNSVGCTLGLGGCSDGPPYFCSGYFAHRSTGATPQQILELFAGILDLKKLAQDGVDVCEPKWQAQVDANHKAESEKLAQQLLDKEIEKAQQGGSPNALGFAFRWSPKCWDDVCKSSISKYADLYNAEIKDPDTIKEHGTFGAAVYALEKKYGGLATVAVALSKDRRDKKLRSDPSAPVADRLDAFGCRPFLGRPLHALCKAKPGYDVCRQYVTAGKWNLCMLAGSDGYFSAGTALRKLLTQAGCIPGSLRGFHGGTNFQCLGSSALATCLHYRRGGSPAFCGGAMPVSFDLRRLPSSLPPLATTPPKVVPVETMPDTPRVPRLRPGAKIQPPTTEKSTLCLFEQGPRAGQRQDYAPMDPLPVGTPCHDGRGSSGHVVR